MRISELEKYFPRVYDILIDEMEKQSDADFNTNLIGNALTWDITELGYVFWSKADHLPTSSFRKYLQTEYPFLLRNREVKYKDITIKTNIFT